MSTILVPGESGNSRAWWLCIPPFGGRSWVAPGWAQASGDEVLRPPCTLVQRSAAPRQLMRRGQAAATTRKRSGDRPNSRRVCPAYHLHMTQPRNDSAARNPRCCHRGGASPRVAGHRRRLDPDPDVACFAFVAEVVLDPDDRAASSAVSWRGCAHWAESLVGVSACGAAAQRFTRVRRGSASRAVLGLRIMLVAAGARSPVRAGCGWATAPACASS
jgi:hypothetical protein